MIDVKRVRGLLALAWVVLGGVLICGPAMAQSNSNITKAPVVESTDGNGIDLVTGQVNLAADFISIGASGSGLTRAGYGIGAPVGDNFSGAVDDDGSGNLTISMGGSSELFNLVSGALVSAEGSNNTLSCNSTDCLYTLADGTVADYSRSLTATGGVVANYATLVSVTKPDGEVITMTFRATGSTRYPLSVGSTLGWMLKYHVTGDLSTNYVPVKIEAVNTSVDYCDPTALTCAGATVSWPYILLSDSGPTDVLGHKTTFNGGMDSPTSIVSPLGVTKTITYYTSGGYSGRVYQVALGGSTWTYAYSLTGSVQTTTVTDPNGSVRTFKYDSTAKQIVSDADEMGRKTSYTYYTSTGSGGYKGAVWQVINPDATYSSGTTLTGGYTEYTYDARGNVTGTSIKPKTSGTAITTSATYASSCSNAKTCNKPLTTTDAAGVTTTYTYDSATGNIATVTLPAVGGVAPQIRYSYALQTPYVKNSSGGLVASTQVYRLTTVSTCMTTSSCSGNADEKKTVIDYTGNNNVLPVSRTVARGDANLGSAATSSNEYSKVTYTYDSFGNVATADGPISGDTDEVFYFYDALNRQTGVIGRDPDDSGSLTRRGRAIVFDNDGNVTSETMGSVSATTSSALSGMTIKEKSTTEYSTTTGLPTFKKYFPGTASTPQNITQFSYDNVLRVDCVAQRLNSSVFGSLPSSACTLGTTGSDGPDRIVKSTYNAAGQLLQSISGYGVLARLDQTNTYNSNGTLASVADDKSNLTSYTYDNFNRVTKACYPNPAMILTSSTTDCEQKGYTGAQLTTKTLRDGQTVSVSYDALSRVTGLSSAVIETYAYDNFSQVTSHTANSLTETFTYDVLNGMLSDAQPMGTVTYVYDAYRRRAQMTYPAYGGHTFSVSYDYFNDGSAKSEATSYDGATSVMRAQFAQDNFGRIDSISLGSSGQVVIDPSYDTSSRLTGLTNNLAGTTNDSTWAYTYSQAWQIKTRTQSGSTSYNYAPASSATTAYTHNGLNQMTGSNSSTLTYDSRGNLTSDGVTTYSYNAYNLLTGTSSGATLTYDPSNRLASLAKSGTTTKFLYDGSDLIAEYDGSNVLLRRYVHGPDSDQPLVWFDGTSDSTPQYMVSDNLGSITAVTDASGNMLNINTYDEYGVPAAGNTGRFQYTGQTWLPEVGLYYYKSRMYAPSLGRFLQTDPTGYGDGMNIYAYVGGNPVNFVDPTGQYDEQPQRLNCTGSLICGSIAASMTVCYGNCSVSSTTSTAATSTAGASGAAPDMSPYNHTVDVSKFRPGFIEASVVVITGARRVLSGGEVALDAFLGYYDILRISTDADADEKRENRRRAIAAKHDRLFQYWKRNKWEVGVAAAATAGCAFGIVGTGVLIAGGPPSGGLAWLGLGAAAGGTIAACGGAVAAWGHMSEEANPEPELRD